MFRETVFSEFIGNFHIFFVFEVSSHDRFAHFAVRTAHSV